MAYLRVYQAKGDPFLGGLIGGIGKLAKGAIGLIGGKGAKAADIGKAVADALAKGGRGALPGAGVAAGAAAAGAVGGALMGRRMAASGEGRRYRRMNPGNVKALRRSMRRVTSFAKLARSTMTFTKTHRIKKGRKR